MSHVPTLLMTDVAELCRISKMKVNKYLHLYVDRCKIHINAYNNNVLIRVPWWALSTVLKDKTDVVGSVYLVMGKVVDVVIIETTDLTDEEEERRKTRVGLMMQEELFMPLGEAEWVVKKMRL